MRTARRARALGLAVLAALPLLACSDGADRGAWDDIDEIHYLVPDSLPEGWVVSHATLRPGRPRDEWRYRADVFADARRERFLVVGGEPIVDGDGAPRDVGEHGPGPVEAVDVDELAYLFIYARVAPDEEATARGISWGSGGLYRRVIEVTSAGHDDALLRAVAEQHADARDLDFELPSAALEAGFEPVASLTELEDVADYSIVWRSADDAGRTRDEALDVELRPYLHVNVAARMFAAVPRGPAGASLPDDPDEAVVERDDDGSMTLQWVGDGLPVTVGGQGVDEAALRALARSLRALPYDVWVAYLGDRLLVDEPG